jgi:hypothetical protein
MDDRKFEELFAAARNAFRTGGDDLAVRSKARHQYRQAIDLLEIECDAAQWARVEAAIAAKWR